MAKTNKIIIPNHLQIETLNGLCTARCTMCAFPTWTRKPYRMTMPVFSAVLEKFLPYKDHLQYLSLFGFGEPLLDRGLPNKVRKAKGMGFNSVGFATNCTELNYFKSYALLYAGLDTIICSVDGIRKETHELIRVGTHFDEVVYNIRQFITLRNHGYKTKVIIRFIRQTSNAHEWEEFREWWERQLDPGYGDAVISFDVVDCDGKVADYEGKDVLQGIAVPVVCDQINQRMIVLSTGDVALCCADDNAKFHLGNVLERDPVEIYNGVTLVRYRTLMAEGRIGDLDLCNTCTIARSMKMKEV